MKYIVFEVSLENGNKLELPVIFPDILVHAMVNNGLKATIAEHFKNVQMVKPISAGMCTSAGLETNCAGHSESLLLDSREGVDDDLIMMMDYGSMHK